MSKDAPLIFCYTFFLMTIPAHAEPFPRFSLGGGIGANFAHSIGVSGGYYLDRHHEVVVAFGMKNHYSVAIRHHFLKGGGFWQPRIGLSYGTNGDLRLHNQDKRVRELGYPDTYRGLSLTGGSRLAFGRKRQHGVGLDISYKLTDDGYSEDRRSYAETYASHALTDMGVIFGLFSGRYNLQFSAGWEMKF